MYLGSKKVDKHYSKGVKESSTKVDIRLMMFALLLLGIDQDGAEPSGNSVAAANLMRLSTLLDCDEYRDKAGRMFRLFSQRLTKVPIALPAMVSALMLYENSPPEVR